MSFMIGGLMRGQTPENLRIGIAHDTVAIILGATNVHEK